MEILLTSTEETKKLAEQVAGKLRLGNTLALYGDLGSGKTTFTGFLVKALGVEARVQSPTFVIRRKYQHINHLDLYRLQNEQDLDDLGLEELFADKNAINIIEWPEVAERLLPHDTIKIKFEYIDENIRKAYVQNLH